MESREEAILRALREEMQRRGKKGGLARAKSTTAEQRRRIAVKASNAAAARKKQARLKTLVHEITSGTKALLRKAKKAERKAIGKKAIAARWAKQKKELQNFLPQEKRGKHNEEIHA